MLQEKLVQFKNAVFDEANQKAIQIRESAELLKNKTIQQNKEEKLDQGYLYLNKKSMVLKKEYDSLVSRNILLSKKEILIKRNEITQRIFDNIEKKLKAYTVTSEYRQKLNNQIKCFLEKNGNDYNIFVRKEDAEFLTDIKFTVSNKIHLGGFIASNENLYFDNTLENRLDLQKEYYIKNSSFELED